MIKYCIEKWDKNKDLLRSALLNMVVVLHVIHYKKYNVFLDTRSRNESVDDLMNLCKDLICNMIKPYNTGWRYDERFSMIK